MARAPDGELLLGDLYHDLLTASWPRLLCLLTTFYLLANALFALAYLAGPASIENARPGSFVDAFFFSVQTMATIGYGKMVPHTLWANVLVTMEALFGLLGVAMVTGLMFAKFSRPTARVLFSRRAVVAPFNGTPSLMFRMANARGNNIVEAQVHVVLARNEITAEGHAMRRFHDLEMARRQSALFTLSWTAIHPITEQSPLRGATQASLDAVEAEVIVSLLGFEEHFSQTVHARHRYRPADIAWGSRFVDILPLLRRGRRILDYTHFHDLEPIGPSE